MTNRNGMWLKVGAAVIALMLSVVGFLLAADRSYLWSTADSALQKAHDNSADIRVLKIQRDLDAARLKRIEDKVDKILERLGERR